MKHSFREHDQEADHLANLGTEGKTKITIENGSRILRTGMRCEGTGMETKKGRSGCKSLTSESGSLAAKMQCR